MDPELYSAITAGNLPRVKRFVNGGTSTAAKGDHPNALTAAALCGEISIVEWLLTVGSAEILEANAHGYTVLMCSEPGKVRSRQTYTYQLLIKWLLEIATKNDVWNVLQKDLVHSQDDDCDRRFVYDSAAETALLRVMLLRQAPPAKLVIRMSNEHIRVAREGARLRAGLPAYLAHRRALLDAHCPLIAPLRDLVHGYEVPTTSTELWATGVGKEAA
jgi:hypothetical protein